ncbi:acyltransferase [Mesorhizobium sp. B2-3-4]|uniref:acyltransferase family protein n=1 Tax=Mesorhizobium sp. B2-3-4 TaxID=2589959 RepID=UPI001FEF1076|nr:acyltransferase [Mesorhizobium sp. B2-3-4]
MIGLYDFWPAFVVVALLWPLAGLPLFQRVGFGGNSARIRAIDGMRGYLALAVVLHHAVMYHELLTNGVWERPRSAFYDLLGQAGVSFFFIITAYLFWGKLLSAKGPVNFPTLLLKRAFRIGPLYILAVGLAMGLEVVDAGIDYSSFATYERALLNFLFGAFDYIPLSSSRVCTLACVAWTLRYEWLFYFSLPIAAIFSRHPVARIGLPGILLVFSTIASASGGSAVYSYLGLFAGGMLCATLETNAWLLRVHRHALSAFGLAMLTSLFVNYDTAYAAGPVLVSTAVFFLIVSGADFFGLLTALRSVRLGEISYGIYLLQGLAFVLVFSVAPIRGFALESAGQYWLVTLMVMVVLIAMALAAHLLVEKPGVSLGGIFATTLRLPTRDEAQPAAAAGAQPWLVPNLTAQSPDRP